MNDHDKPITDSDEWCLICGARALRGKRHYCFAFVVTEKGWGTHTSVRDALQHACQLEESVLILLMPGHYPSPGPIPEHNNEIEIRGLTSEDLNP